MRLSHTGSKASTFLLKEIHAKRLILPTEASLKYIGEEIGCTPQSVGSAYPDFIEPVLLANGIVSRKCGKPVVLQLHCKGEAL